MNNSEQEKIIEIERSALERWGKGDPSGFLEITSEDVVYFDPFVEKRLDGKKALNDLYESIRGKIYVDSFELLNPKVQGTADMAVLTFNYVSVTEGKEDKWNCTEVYQKISGEWKIIQTHWSMTTPFK